MIFWTDNKVILFLADYKFPIDDTIKFQPFFVANREGVNHQDISLVISSKDSTLKFYIVCDSEESFETKEVNGRTFQNKVYRLYLQQYFVSEDKVFIERFISDLNCEPKHTFLKFSESERLRSYELKPFGTVLPLAELKSYKYNYLKQNVAPKDAIALATWIEKTHNIPIVVEPNSTIIQSLKRLSFLNNNSLHFISEEIGSQEAKVLYSKALIKSLNKEQVELKSSHQIAFANNFISDEEEKYLIKKGIEFFFEELEEKNNIGFSYSNFLRSSKSIDQIDLKEPINHAEHQFVNIRTGIRLPKKITELKDINSPENYFETFTNTDIYDLTEGKIRFSQKAFHYQQTNLFETVHLVSKFKECLNGNAAYLDFDKLNNLNWNYRFVKRTRKLIFHAGELHYTSSKGLHHAGVLQIPQNLQLQMLISKKAYEANGSNRILNKVNEAILFLYKDGVNQLTEKDLLIYDYNDFKHVAFSTNLNKEKSVLTYLIDPNKTSHKLNQTQKEKAASINEQIIEILKQPACSFSLVGEIDKYVFANAILKIGLKKGAIPWKVDSIDREDSNHIFIGIDLGHNHQNRTSNLTLTAINNEGCFIDCAKADNIEMNEMIPLSIVHKTFKRLFKKIKNKNLNIQKLTVHRDGRYFENVTEFANAIRTATELATSININLVEVIKNEVPLIGFRNNENFLDSFEGLYFFIGDTSYLVTNDQSLNTKTAPKPLKIRKVLGDKSIEQITEEIYWLTKPYSINLFMPSKLPLTTLLANNLSYSRDLNHFITA